MLAVSKREEEVPPAITSTASAVTQPATVNSINDKDYLPSKFNIPGHYNYLDPNYMPSS